MTQSILITSQVYAVEVPEGMNAFKVECMPRADFYELTCYQLGEYDEPINEKSIDLPAGEWQYMGTIEEVTEEQAKDIVAEVRLRGHIRYEDYTREFMWHETAVESFRSLLTSKGLDTNKNYILLKRN